MRSIERLKSDRAEAESAARHNRLAEFAGKVLSPGFRSGEQLEQNPADELTMYDTTHPQPDDVVLTLVVPHKGDPSRN